MSILFIAPETTGMWKYKGQPTDPEQPHMIRLASITNEDDANPVVHIIWPDPEWLFEPGAVRVHGIDRNYALEHGVLTRIAMQQLQERLSHADAVVMFSSAFQMNVLGRAFRDAELEPPAFPLVIDALREAQGLLHANAPRKFEDCVQYFTGEPYRIPSDPLIAGQIKVRALRSIWRGTCARQAAHA